MKSIDRFVPDTVYGHYVEGVVFDGDAIKIPALRKEFHSANILQVTAGTNGLMGGDSGHGSRTIVRFADLGGTDIKVYPVKDDYGNGGCEIHLGGDCELLTMIDGLRFAADSLEKLLKEANSSSDAAAISEDATAAGGNQ